MKLSSLDYVYPEKSVATEPQRPTRVMWVAGDPKEVTLQEIMAHMQPGDVVVVNNTKVIKRRVFGKNEKGDETEVLFLNQVSDLKWEVLLLAKKMDINEKIFFPGGVILTLEEKGMPQIVSVN